MAMVVCLGALITHLILLGVVASGNRLYFDRPFALKVIVDGRVRSLNARVGDTVEVAVERFGFGLRPEHQIQLGVQLAASFREHCKRNLLPRNFRSVGRNVKNLQATVSSRPQLCGQLKGCVNRIGVTFAVLL